MRDILIDGLPILDLLEVTPSTSNVALLANCDQSSVSRIYRHVSSSLQLGFRKSNGTYSAHTNQELLASLRQATQLLRLQRGADHLQWVGNWWNGAALANLNDHTPLPRPWQGEQRTLMLLDSRVLDLAVLDLAALQNQEALPAAERGSDDPLAWGPWSAIPLAHYPAGLRASMAALHAQPPAPRTKPSSGSTTDGTVHGQVTDVALVRREHLERPALQALIASLKRAYRQAYGHLDGICWP